MRVGPVVLALMCGVVSGCADRAELRDAKGEVVLGYRCDAVRPHARSARERALVREYAINALRDARDHGRLAAADPIISAYEQQGTQLETAVARYLCEHGDVRAAGRPRFPEGGSTPPDFVLRRFDGRGEGEGATVRGRDLAGKIVVLNFWATWCGPCLKEMPELHHIAETYRDSGVVVLGVMYRDDPAKALRWMRDQGIEVPLLLDRAGGARDAYGVRGVPDTYIIGRDGKMASRQLGNAGPGAVERRVRRALAANAPT